MVLPAALVSRELKRRSNLVQTGSRSTFSQILEWIARAQLTAANGFCSGCEAFQRNAQLQSKAISPPVVLDLARQLPGHTALGKNAAKAASLRCIID